MHARMCVLSVCSPCNSLHLTSIIIVLLRLLHSVIVAILSASRWTSLADLAGIKTMAESQENLKEPTDQSMIDGVSEWDLT